MMWKLIILYNILYKMMGAHNGHTELSDEKIVEIITSNSSTIRDLVYIIYTKFYDLDSILHLFNITNFKISQHQDLTSYFDNRYESISDTMYSYRASVISLGTKIIFDRHRVILSNMLTLIYFFVEYLRENSSLTEDTKFPQDENVEGYQYIKNYMPLPKDMLYNMNTPLNLFNTIDSQVISGSRLVHFFISSAPTLPTRGYLIRAIQTAGSEYIPVIITIKISSENPAVKSVHEDDHVISPVLFGDHIESIRLIEKDDIGETTQEMPSLKLIKRLIDSWEQV